MNIVDETLIKAGNEFVWLWIATEPSNKAILEMRISYERNILIAEHFTRSLVRKYGKQPVSTNGGISSSLQIPQTKLSSYSFGI
jgi:putative transposase